MIEYDDRIRMMLNNILFNVEVIRKDFEHNGKTHYNYILEKLSKAKWDLDLLVDMAKEEEKNELR